MVRLILFDIDGTLVRTGGAGVRAFAKVFAAEFRASEGFDRLNFAGRTDLSLLREFFDLHQIPLTPENYQRFFDQYIFWLDHLLERSRTEICPGVVDFIRQARELPHPPLLGLLTGNIRLGAEIKLRHFGLWNEFAIGGFADDHEDRCRIAAVARERGERALGETLAADQVLVVGDTPLDIRCARAIGAKALAVATGGSSLEELRPHQADWTVPDLTRVKAKEVVCHPAG